MSAKHFIPIPLTEELTQILRDILGAFGQAVSASDLHIVLATMSAPQFAPFRHTRVEAVEDLLNALVTKRKIKRTANGDYQATALGSEALRELVLQPTYANLATAISQAKPIAPNQPVELSAQYLRRDSRRVL